MHSFIRNSCEKCNYRSLAGIEPSTIHSSEMPTKYSMLLTSSADKFFVVLHGEQQYKFSFVETPREFIIAKLSIRKIGSSSVLIICIFKKHVHACRN
jgi:hypothetical protein